MGVPGASRARSSGATAEHENQSSVCDQERPGDQCTTGAAAAWNYNNDESQYAVQSANLSVQPRGTRSRAPGSSITVGASTRFRRRSRGSDGASPGAGTECGTAPPQPYSLFSVSRNFLAKAARVTFLHCNISFSVLSARFCFFIVISCRRCKTKSKIAKYKYRVQILPDRQSPSGLWRFGKNQKTAQPPVPHDSGRGSSSASKVARLRSLGWILNTE